METKDIQEKAFQAIKKETQAANFTLASLGIDNASLL